jgi:eukaryotic-like serine/threonine-protein kinase
VVSLNLYAIEGHGREGQEKAESATWKFSPGTPIADGRWVMKSLGGGSRYEACLVWDDRLFSLAVAKILRPDHAEDPGSLRDLRREGDLLTLLAHPSLVRGFGAVYEGTHPHVLIEYLEGPTLGRLIKLERTLTLAQLLPLALHIAAALQYMATEGFVHLDVKPGNIVMGVPPRLIDLSIARSLERAARLTDPIGTDPYMPPEQCDPVSFPGRIGPAADVFGLGATLYHAITGSVPYPRPRGASKSDQLETRFPQLVNEPDPLPKGVPAPLADLVRRMLAKEPDQRPAAREVAELLEPLVVEQPRRLTVSSRGRLRVAKPNNSRLARHPSAEDGDSETAAQSGPVPGERGAPHIQM